MSCRLVIDPVPAVDSASDLFASDNEYSVAVAGLRRHTDLLRTLPDALWLELYGFEFLERVRSVEGGGVLQIPFWPGAVFEAAGIVTHCWREIEAMLPDFDEVEIRPASAADLTRAADRVFGELRFPIKLYQASLQGWATARGRR